MALIIFPMKRDFNGKEFAFKGFKGLLDVDPNLLLLIPTRRTGDTLIRHSKVKAREEGGVFW